MRLISVFCASLLSLSALSATSLAVAAETETLPSGVSVTHLKRGSGPSPKASDSVTVHYRGTLENGTEFDSSFARNKPISFPLARVIPCWTEAMQTLKVGGKARLTCPSDTAYGKRGMPGTIPPNSTLNFEVELLGIGK